MPGVAIEIAVTVTALYVTLTVTSAAGIVKFFVFVMSVSVPPSGFHVILSSSQPLFGVAVTVIVVPAAAEEGSTLDVPLPSSVTVTVYVAGASFWKYTSTTGLKSPTANALESVISVLSAAPFPHSIRFSVYPLFGVAVTVTLSPVAAVVGSTEAVPPISGVSVMSVTPSES